jgi:ABC-type transport system substrate-binding protein
MNRLALGTAAIAALGILATGCKATVTTSSGPTDGTTSSPATAAPATGSTTKAPSSPHPTTGTTTTTTTYARCHSRGLHADVVGYDAGAGQRYARLVLVNISGHPCRMYGFPGLELGTSSEGFGGTTIRSGGALPAFVIPAGGHAHATLHWTAVPADDETGPQCEDTPTYLQVIPPNETTPIIASWTGGPVCRHNQLSVTAFAAGPGA